MMRVKHRIKHTPFSEWRFHSGCTISFTTFILLLISFVTPYWLQSWSRLHTSFQRLGLWEFCLKGYVDRTDPDLVSYFDCWWILSPYFQRIFVELVPFWFMIIQILFSIALAVQVVLFILLIVYLCERITHVERRIFAINVMAGGHTCTALLILPAIILFGANFRNPEWMPYPRFNWPSWSFGCGILATFSAIFSSLCFSLMARELRRDLEDITMNFPMTNEPKHRRRWKLRRDRWSDDKNADDTKGYKQLPQMAENSMIPMSEFNHDSFGGQPAEGSYHALSNSQLTSEDSPTPEYFDQSSYPPRNDSEV